MPALFLPEYIFFPVYALSEAPQEYIKKYLQLPVHNSLIYNQLVPSHRYAKNERI